MILFNGNIVESASLDLGSEFFNYNSGLFETILYKNNTLALFDRHLERLKNSAKFYNIEVNLENILENKILDFITKNNLLNSTLRVKIIIYKGNSFVLLYNYLDEIKKWSLAIHPEIREGAIYNHKTTNYMNNVYLSNLYLEKQFDEVGFVNKKYRILEGTKTNIMALYNKNIYYVDYHENYLKGIMQQFIIDNHKEFGFKKAIAKQKGFSVKFLRNCQRVYLANSLILAQPIDKIVTKKPNKKELFFDTDFKLYEKINKKLF